MWANVLGSPNAPHTIRLCLIDRLWPHPPNKDPIKHAWVPKPLIKKKVRGIYLRMEANTGVVRLPWLDAAQQRELLLAIKRGDIAYDLPNLPFLEAEIDGRELIERDLLGRHDVTRTSHRSPIIGRCDPFDLIILSGDQRVWVEAKIRPFLSTKHKTAIIDEDKWCQLRTMHLSGRPCFIAYRYTDCTLLWHLNLRPTFADLECASTTSVQGPKVLKHVVHLSISSAQRIPHHNQ
jgi:hypothetical protein